MVKAYKVEITGTYRTGDKEIIDYQGIKGVIPYIADESFAQAMVTRRYALMWITNSDKYKKRVQSIREVYFDVMEETEVESFSYIGKDIKKMSYGELQDLATVKDLRAIPLYKKGGLRQAQITAYYECMVKLKGITEDYIPNTKGDKDINGKDILLCINPKLKEFNFADLPSIVVDEDSVRNITKTISNEEMIAMEQKSTDAEKGIKSSISRAELEKLAEEKNINFHPSIKDENLYNKILNA